MSQPGEQVPMEQYNQGYTENPPAYNPHGVQTTQPLHAPGSPPPGAPPYGAIPPPVTAQPGQDVAWMQAPTGVPGCPRGLEYLTQIDQLLVKQEIELLELVVGWEQSNKYRVFNSMNQQVYFAKEESNACMRQCCGASRGFVIHITDNMSQEVLRITREFKCCAGCCWCAACDACAFDVLVDTPSGEVMGYVRQECSCWKPKMSILDNRREVIGEINGPCCQCACCSDVEFPVSSPGTGGEIGKIAKQWTGFGKETFTDADNFSITFPMDMDVKMKATMLGALFLVDFMFFEQKANNNN